MGLDGIARVVAMSLNGADSFAPVPPPNRPFPSHVVLETGTLKSSIISHKVIRPPYASFRVRIWTKPEDAAGRVALYVRWLTFYLSWGRAGTLPWRWEERHTVKPPPPPPPPRRTGTMSMGPR